MSSTASAPAKVILFGEHFVVYDVKAILCSINRRVKVTTTPIDEKIIRIKSKIGQEDIKAEEETRPSFRPFAFIARKAIKEFNYEKGLEITIDSDIPSGVGLGSSSACCVAAAASVFGLFSSTTKEEILKILPIGLISQDKNTAIKIGHAVAKIAKSKNAMIIGSSDFTHYEPNDFAYAQDKALIETILNMDIDAFYKVLEEKQVTACGYGAIASTIIACKELGATKSTLLKYATSGDLSGEKTSVVGYGSIVFN